MAEYIEKEAVVHHFMTKRQYLTKDLVMDAAYEVSKFPAADVEPMVHGRWVYEAETMYTKSGFRCSACRVPLWLSPDVPQAFLYCPNCGARMDGE